VYVVDDIKTGRPENVDAIGENAQMLTLGLLFARYFGVDTIAVFAERFFVKRAVLRQLMSATTVTSGCAIIVFPQLEEVV
jgi:hypothetical protein